MLGQELPEYLCVLLEHVRNRKTIRAFLNTLLTINTFLDRGHGFPGEEGELLWVEAPHLGFDEQDFGDLNALLAWHTVLATMAEPAPQIVSDLLHLLPVVVTQGFSPLVKSDNLIDLFYVNKNLLKGLRS